MHRVDAGSAERAQSEMQRVVRENGLVSAEPSPNGGFHGLTMAQGRDGEISSREEAMSGVPFTERCLLLAAYDALRVAGDGGSDSVRAMFYVPGGEESYFVVEFRMPRDFNLASAQGSDVLGCVGVVSPYDSPLQKGALDEQQLDLLRGYRFDLMSVRNRVYPKLPENEEGTVSFKAQDIAYVIEQIVESGSQVKWNRTQQRLLGFSSDQQMATFQSLVGKELAKYDQVKDAGEDLAKFNLPQRLYYCFLEARVSDPENLPTAGQA